MGGNASFGYGKNDSQQQSQQASQSTSSQDIWGAQSPALQQLYGNAMDIMGGGSPYAQQAQATGAAGTNAWMQQLQPGSNPYFDQSVQASIDQATDSFKRQVLPALTDQGVAAGGLGGSRQALASGEAAGMFGQGLAQSVAQQRAQQYGGDQARAIQALGMTPQMQASAFAPLMAAGQLIGGPTVLGSSQSTSSGSGSGWSSGREYKTSGGGGVKGGGST